MKIWRVETFSGTTWAASEGDEKAPLQRIDGDLFGPWTVTDEPIEDFTILAPLVPPAIFCIGQNYRAHAAELKAQLSEFPTVFMKNPHAVVAPGVPIQLPRALRSEKVDYEVELAVVIGRPCRNAGHDEALNYVLGYTIANDVSARDWQKEWGGGQFCRGKSFDTFCPMGPCIATTGAISTPDALSLRTWVNGELRQEASTADMIHSVADLIVFLSGSTTLAPGTVIMTGTPSGVGMGMRPPRFLQADDQVRMEIEGIGQLENRVIEEPV